VCTFEQPSSSRSRQPDLSSLKKRSCARACSEGAVTEMEDHRCIIVAMEMEDPRCKSLLHGLVHEMEDPRCESLRSVAIGMEDPRCRIVAHVTEDPRCGSLRMW